ncbi:Zn-dependent oxidoreductase, NADPH:quinone reductase (modular protein) [Agrobacterium fabacearum CFBP 5771]|uniref:quinone oxidoreductase family protein n=1 Tax=Agrobacterium tumefaciens TaxID=358 RepID=UPI00046E7F47|nr:NADP-dependent oxidoreductase [Agrobacterium tumefaciens]CVI24545.1 Zn-dependent oxidoreductase, NADPH:quinone reductase (modular protein) [Agrobacterium fabacearum CFBP 5771]
MQENPKILPIVGKAVTYLGLSGHGVIKILERTVRVPEANEVRIEVKAAGVNPTDILSRSPGYGKPDEHFVPGMDAAGIVESVGSGVTRLHVGQLVMAAVLPRRPDGGAQAQYIVVPAASVVPIPEGTSLIEASTLPVNGLTAFGALDLAALKECQTFAVSGGAGLLAHYAIAVAKRQGLKVIADAKPEEADLVRSYGADVVERGPGFAEAIRREVPEGVDALLDTALLGEKSFGAIRDGGIYIPVRGWTDKPSERVIEIKPVWVDTLLERTDWLEKLRDMVEASEIKLRVTGQYSPEEAAEAQRTVEAGGLRGRPVIIF